jgi:hypothetical protein
MEAGWPGAHSYLNYLRANRRLIVCTYIHKGVPEILRTATTIAGLWTVFAMTLSAQNDIAQAGYRVPSSSK